MFARKKEEYREYYLNIRKSITPEEVKEKSAVIVRRVLDLPAWQEAQTVMLYVPINNEVDVTSLITKALDEGKNVLLPKVELKNEIVPYKINHFPEDVAPGFKNIPEPIPGKAIPWNQEIQLIIVPGIVFDVRGGRIGYGLGCYDRFLKKHSEALKIGVTFERCITYSLPLDAEDERLDMVITDEHTFKVEKESDLFYF